MEIARQHPRRGRVISRAILILEILCALYFVARQAPTLWHDRWAQDDAYISFRYANHLVHGYGLVYNVGQRVEGYTNFLWTMLSAVPLALGADDPLPFMHVVSLVLWILSYLVLLRLGVKLFHDGIWIAPLALVPLTYHWSFNMWYLSGMETPLVSFLTIATLYLFSRDPQAHPAALFLTSLSAVALTMSRPDGVLIFPALALAGLTLYWRRLLVERKWVRYLILPAAPVLLIYAPYTVWRVLYYGSFYPNTYYAKVAYLPFYTRGWEYLRTYFRIYPFAPHLGLVAVGAVVTRSETARRYLWGTLLATACVFFYVVRIGGDFMEWRFVTPVTGLLYPAIVIGGSACAERLMSVLSGRRHAPAGLAGEPVETASYRSRTAGALIGAVVASGLAMTTARATEAARHTVFPGGETIGLLRRYCDTNNLNWGAAGKLFDQVLPKKVKIATTSAGIIPFFCDRPCLDLHGLTDPEIAHVPVDPNHRGRVGHEHWLKDYKRMQQRGVDVYLYWVDPKPFPESLLTPPHDGLETVSARLPNGHYVKFLILNDRALDMNALRSDPRLVFYGSRKMGDRTNIYALRDPLAGYKIIDALDLEDDVSQKGHAFEETFPPGGDGHIYHEKMLEYRPPFNGFLVYDNGRRIAFQARWKVMNVSARNDLVMAVRFDRTGGGVYDLEVNGDRVAEELILPGGTEAWDEASVTIPAAQLVDGTNEFRMSLSRNSANNAEIYSMWFLQPAVEPEIPSCSAMCTELAHCPAATCDLVDCVLRPTSSG
jgi:hypothetical protein